MNLAACIILYHPDIADLQRNIRAIAGHVDTLILWRNSPEEIPLPEDLPCKPVWMGDGTNQYISRPLNSCLSYCLEGGYDYLLTMDQDSEFEDFGGFLAKAEALAKEPSFDRTVIFAPNVNHRYGGDPSVLSVDSTITSGSLCNVRAALECGGFREAYQIYWVDSEFCHRAKLNGWNIFTLTDFNLRQQFGKKTFAHGHTSYNYSAQTYYFMFRNMLWMHREYKSNPSVKCILYTSKLYFSSILAGETDKWKKLKAVGRGIRHGLFGKYR